MRCPYCYIPFIEHTPGDLSLWQKIIDKIVLYNPDIVTFGGGDPFAHERFEQLIDYCKKYPFQTHIDTNGISMTESILSKISNFITMIGLPLDGGEVLHDQIRKYNGHHHIVCDRLELLLKYHIPVRINTVLFPNEQSQLIDIATQIKVFPNIQQWFIYEYWHFDGINSRPSAPALFDKSKYEFLFDIIKNVDIRFSSVSERSPSYVFVSSCGNIYTISNSSESYVELGNILSPTSDLVLSSLSNINEIDKRAKLKLLNHSDSQIT